MALFSLLDAGLCVWQTGPMKKLIAALVLLAIAMVFGITRLVLNDSHTDGLVLAILGTGVPGVWMLASIIDDTMMKRRAE